MASHSFSLHRRLSRRRSPPPTMTKKKKPKDKPPRINPSVSTASSTGPAASASASIPSSPPSVKSTDLAESKLPGPINAPASSCPADLPSFPPLVVDEYGKPSSQTSAIELHVPEKGTNEATSEHPGSRVHPQSVEQPADVVPCSPKTNLQLHNQQGAKVQASLWKEKVSNLDLVGQTVVLKEVDRTDSTEYGCAFHGDKIVGGIQKLATGDASGSTGFLTIRFEVLLRQNSGNGFGARMSLEVNEDEEKIRYEE
ncbi:hypothetical protein HID58_081346 [Brassica napus]|uniref:Uncharacterized protein n=1 Tax=Brassica napus TaxID=3708 RepID=A0ABQ7YAN5_BRANA|nr:hypothetical protein HID58_081346 [Brassica napus]